MVSSSSSLTPSSRKRKQNIQWTTLTLWRKKTHPQVGVCERTIFDHGLKKIIQDLLLEKYRSIVLQRTFFQLQFWHRRINKLYSNTYIHISVNSAVELLSQDTALIRNHKSTLFACFKAFPLNVSFACCSDVRVLWVRTPEACTRKSPSNSTW